MDDKSFRIIKKFSISLVSVFSDGWKCLKGTSHQMIVSEGVWVEW